MRHQLASSLQCPPSATSVSALTGVKGTRGGGKGQPKSCLAAVAQTLPWQAPHATTAAQLGRVPIWLMAHLFQRDVRSDTVSFAVWPANSSDHQVQRCLPPPWRNVATAAAAPPGALLFPLPSGSITGDSAFSECQFTAADAGTLPGSKICARLVCCHDPPLRRRVLSDTPAASPTQYSPPGQNRRPTCRRRSFSPARRY